MDFFFTDKKIENLLPTLQALRYKEKIELHNICIKEDDSGIPNPSVPVLDDSWEKISLGKQWSGRDAYLWLYGELEIPASWAGKGMIAGHFDFGRTGEGFNSGFESLLYMDGKPFQGVDTHHNEVFLDDSWAGRTVPLFFRLWSGLEGGGTPTVQHHVIRTAESALIDTDTDQLYYLASIALDTVGLMENSDPSKYDLCRALDGALLKIDWTNEGSPEFYASVSDALTCLQTSIESMEKKTNVEVTAVGHTHIDVAWLWRYKHTREKAARSFSTVLRLMDMYPEYTFFQSQPQVYDYIKTDYPELFERIKEKVKEGRWEIDGGMWVEPDCNMPCGESLTRQLLFGTRFAKNEFGKDMHCLWLPDVFGYSWALPQILKKSGIHTFYTTKISWNEYNRVNNDTFKWIGIDGSEIMAHFITTSVTENEEGLIGYSPYYTYNGEMTPDTVLGLWKNYQNKDITHHLLCSYGWGDGGGGVDREMLEKRRDLDEVPGMPSVKTGHVRAITQDLKEKVDAFGWKTPTWDGELYLEYHRGTYTSHACVKKNNRRLELQYRNAEMLSVLSGIMTGRVDNGDREKLNEGWKIILRNQFHDVLPGSSIHDVYEDEKREHGEAANIAAKVEKAALNRIVEEKDGVYTVVNNAGWRASGLVELPALSGVDYFDASGELLQSQTGEDKTFVYMEDLPATSFSSIYVKKSVPHALQSAFSMEGRELRTPFYKITFNEFGQITSVYDKDNHRQVMREGDRANVLQCHDDRPFQFESWNTNIYYKEKCTEVTDLVSFKMTECGPLRAVVHAVWRFNKSTIEQDMVVYAHSRRIDFVTTVDMQENKKLLRVAFPVDVRSTYGTYDIQYGNVQRPNHWNTSWDIAKFETVAHKWMDLSEYNYGVSILNDCKYGCNIHGRDMSLSLIKTATNPDHLQDLGEHHFTYSFYPHGGDVFAGGVEKEAFNLNNPLYAVEGQCQTGSLVALSSEFVALDAVKRTEDGENVLVRFHEYTGATRKITVTPGFKYSGWAESDLMENPCGEFQSGAITMEIKPYEVKTVIIRL